MNRISASLLKSSSQIYAKKIFQSFSTYKTTTGLVGISVDHNGRDTLLNISADVLKSVQRIPEGTQYRTNIEKWFNYFTKVATASTDIKTIEDEIELGQIEEVILMAKDELSLIDYYYENKIWEVVEQEKKDADEMVAQMADSVYFSSPQEPTPPPTPPK